MEGSEQLSVSSWESLVIGNCRPQMGARRIRLFVGNSWMVFALRRSDEGKGLLKGIITGKRLIFRFLFARRTTMFCTIDEIIESLRNAKKHGKKCSVLIGAGCSVSAGIPTAQGFVDIIREDFRSKYEKADEKTYAKCMAQLADSEQYDLIAEKVDNARVNWAHVALAQLMKSSYVDRVLTTNFDPLVLRACSLVGLFPAIYDLAASSEFKRDRLPEHAIFHLHGQRNGFILINTEERFKSHSKTLKPVFEDAGSGHVWVVVGYSGEDQA